MIEQSKIKTEYDTYSVSYRKTNSEEILEWIPEFDIDLSDTISEIKIVTQKNTNESEIFLVISNDEGIKNSLSSQGAEIGDFGGYSVKASPQNLTHSATHLIIKKLKDNAAPEQILQYVQKKLGCCSIFCENELSSNNINLLFSGYMRNVQTEIKTNIPNDIQLLATSFGLPKHK